MSDKSSGRTGETVRQNEGVLRGLQTDRAAQAWTHREAGAVRRGISAENKHFYMQIHESFWEAATSGHTFYHIRLSKEISSLQN